MSVTVLNTDVGLSGKTLTVNDATQTLTNKTLTAPTLTTPVVSSGAVDLQSGQITFPATQAASAGANTLDDYEEGSWAPVIGGAGGTSGQTYSTQGGFYTKVGRLVVASGVAILSAKGTITGNVEIQGLPVAAGNLTNFFAVLPLEWRALNTNWVNIVARVASTGAVAIVEGATAAGVANTTALTTADITNTSGFVFTIIYFSAS